MRSFQFSNSHIDLMERDSDVVFGWRYSPKIMFKSGKGTKLIDVDGNEYYDLTSGMMSLPLGHSHPEITEAIREQAGLLVHESSWYSNPWLVEFAELLGSTLPGNLQMVNFAVTGSEANEVAMRMALAATGKYHIVSVIRGLHGGSLAVESLTTVGGARRQGLGPLMMPASVSAIFAPFCYRCPINLSYPSCEVACLGASEDLMEHVTSKSVAAIIAETIPVAGGMIVPPAEWLPGLRRLANRWEGMLILDEAQLAPARTGKIWAFQHSDVVPDIVTFAKGMSAGLAICGAITTKEIAERVRGNLGLPWGGTYTGDPLPAAVALRQLQIILRDDMASRSERLGSLLKSKLNKLSERFDLIGEIRGKGLYYMIDVVADRRTKRPDPKMAERIRYNAALAGVVTITVKNFIRVCPPLIVTENEIDDIVGRLESAIEQAVAGYPADVDFTSSSSLAVTAHNR